MTRPESEPLTLTTRTTVLRISTTDVDRAGKSVPVAYIRVPFGIGAGIIALRENHDIKPGQKVTIVRKVHILPGSGIVMSSRLKAVSPPTP